MPTKLSRLAEGLMEAAWLAAVMLTPLFFNIYSSRIFEPEKLALLRSLALIILACWLILWMETGASPKETLKDFKAGWKSWLRTPLFLPAIAVALVTLLSTIFSVTPAISFWGSYPRLQGAYTNMSYLLIFAAMLVHLKRREQVDRLVGVIVLSSLPVSLYGILQRYGLDPIPWGGDVSQRIASNLGNSIFVAAYLIMVFPLTLMRIVEAFEDLLNEEGNLVANFARSVSYVFIGALQVIAIYFSGSRGPWLGWGVSLVVIWLGLSLIWRKRWLTAAGVILATAAAVFLILLNIAGGPLESLRNRAEFGRLGQLLDAESRTGKVRTLIWQGAAELVSPHEPLAYPDGRLDTWNAVRPIIGYGPESMYVAYNRFYPPELALVEKRNASPDRSHNETWDALVTTGLAGLLVYLFLFGSVIYYALKWLGLVRNHRQTYLFLAFLLLGGSLSTALFVAWQGVAYFGVALPFGILLGVIVYLLLSSIAGWFDPITTSTGRLRAYLLLGFLAAIVAHFMEINFGIAIAVTRTYFWVYAALIFLVGYRLPQSGVFVTGQQDSETQGLWEAAQEPSKVGNRVEAEPPRSSGGEQPSRPKHKPGLSAGRKKRRTSQENPSSWAYHDLLQPTLSLGLVLAIPLTILGYNFITNNQRSLSVLTVIWDSFTRIKQPDSTSYGILALLLTTWLAGGIILAAEYQRRETSHAKQKFPILWLGVLIVSILVASIFWLIQAGKLVALAGTKASGLEDVLRQVGMTESLLSGFYVFLLVELLALAAVLVIGQPVRSKAPRFLNGILSIALIFVTVFLASYSNLRVVQADVAFKAAELFTQPGSWPVAIAIYQRANQLAPNEDYYFLFLGRAYLEQAKAISDAQESEALISQAALDLRKAQELNPLNTDHTANLARLYNVWANISTDPALMLERAGMADAYFQQALMLSPKNARLWNEWAMLYLNVLKQPERAYDCIQTALELDPSYDWSYALLGDYYSRVASSQPPGTPSQIEAFQDAAGAYQNALKIAGADSAHLRFSYALALGSIQTQLGQWEQAYQSFSLALGFAQPGEQWRAFEALARLSYQTGDRTRALEYANQAISNAPEDVQERLRQLVADISG